MAQPHTTATPGALFTQHLDTFNAKFADFLAVSTGDATDAQVTDANRAADDAYHAMLATPAPTERGVILKLDALHRYSKGSEHEEGEIAAILADATRLEAVDRSAWDAAFAAMEEAKTADDAVNAIWEAADEAGQEAIDEEWQKLGDVYDNARWALFNVPAPDHAALAWKAENLFGQSVARADCCTPWNSEIIASYMADVRRLLSGTTAA